LYFISVGDSAVYHVRGGQIQMVNRPHVFANLLDQAAERGQISRSEAARHPERESLTSFIGIHDLHEIDRNIEPRPLAEGETVLLASDGMFKTLEPGEIMACLSGHPQSWPQSLVSQTLDRRHPAQDNVTVVSITPDSGALGEWAPQSPCATPEVPSEEVPAAAAPKKRWVLAAVFLLLIAAAFGGLWYLSAR
jgi:serine/threonine protein phosphatase PrpC